MNKITLALVILAILSVSLADVEENYNDLWESCEDQITKYSIYSDAHPDKADTIKAILKCADSWYSDSDGRKKCENDVGTIDDSVKNFYNDCYKPSKDESRNKCQNLDGKCAFEYDKCQSCSTNTSCKSTEKGNMPKQAEFEAIATGTYTNCEEKPSDKCKLDSLKKIAFDSCTTYYVQKCASAYFEANFQEDGCYDYNMCTSSATFLKIALISLIAFFAF